MRSQVKTGQKQRGVKRSAIRDLVGFFEHGLFAPFLLALQPVWHLFLINASEVYFTESIRSLLVSLLLAGVILGLAYLLLGDALRASAAASLFMLFFFLFGDVSDWAMRTLGLGPVRADALVLVVAGTGMIVWIWLVKKRVRNITTVNLYFNLLSLLFLINSGMPVRHDMLGISPSLNRSRPTPVAVREATDSRPDIYYIILDGYGRQDILQSLYDFDNSDFLNALADRGFYIAEEATSNYVQTMLSLSSSLNMDYLQSLTINGRKPESREDLAELLKRSKVRTILAENGYQLVSFRNSYNATIPDAEIYYDDTGVAYPVTAFESLVIDRTLTRILLHVPVFNKILIEIPYETHRNQILSTFGRLQDIPAMEGDYFIYAHIIAPHPPFVFDKTGQALPHREPFKLADGNNYIKSHSRLDYATGYREQLQYMNTLVLETVDAILSGSETPPIIILQGDHGPGLHLHQGSLKKTLPAERFSILSAYYFPDQDYTLLYPSISPVNSFRVLLDQYFDRSDALLPDRHYYSQWGYPFNFTEVTDLSLP